VPEPGDSRKLSDGFPDLERLAFEQYNAGQGAVDQSAKLDRLLRLIGRLIPLGPGSHVCVLGCGPVPQAMRLLLDRGMSATGVEPVVSFVDRANEYLGREAVVVGAAESIPLDDESQDLVLFENVIEHVDSPLESLTEIRRVLKPGGVAYVSTNNRHRFSPIGYNPEFRRRFYNWYPALVKEGYVLNHIHYDPRLANFSQRPAVHWYTFAELCSVGRLAGFAQFYAPVDLLTPADLQGGSQKRSLKHRLFGRRTLGWLQRNAWLRAMLLSQLPLEILMLRRKR
jgi:SAM-dependent methyltransferase